MEESLKNIDDFLFKNRNYADSSSSCFGMFLLLGFAIIIIVLIIYKKVKSKK